jgi:Zn-finger nucleic acid-binding protein
MNCPKCDGPTKTLDFEADLHVERCEQCKGVWMDKGELARYANLSEDLPAGTYNTGKPTTYSCPSCKLKNEKKPLYQTAYSQDLHIDLCKSCHGLWFDHKEVAALKEHLKNLRIAAKLNKTK